MDSELKELTDLCRQLVELCDNEYLNPYIEINKEYRCRFCCATDEEEHDVINYKCPVPEYHKLCDPIKTALMKYDVYMF